MNQKYNFAYLDEQSKKMIRRSVLKALAIPGFQVPFGGREMPLPYGWGTGGIQLTASLIGKKDMLKVIDQGSDDTVNAVSIKDFFKKTTGAVITEKTRQASIIQTRHRIPETALKKKPDHGLPSTHPGTFAVHRTQTPGNHENACFQ